MAIEAMRKHPEEVAAQSHGCYALVALVRKDEGRARIVHAGRWE